MKKKRIAVYISSITGNTRKVLEAATENLSDDWQVCQYDTKEILREDLSSIEADVHIVGFWCRRSSMDDASIALLERLKEQKIILVGTMGNYPEGPYGERVTKNVMEFATKQNEILGLFLCRGKIEESRTQRRRSLPKDHIHYLSDEGYERHLSSRNHPDAKDLKNAEEYVKNILKKNLF